MFFRRYNFIEIIIVVGIISIILGMFARSFFGNPGAIQNKRAVRAFAQSIERMQWISSSEQISTGLCPTSKGLTCETNWSDGWLLFIDVNKDGRLNYQDTIEQVETKYLPDLIKSETHILTLSKTGHLTTQATFYFCSEKHQMKVDLNRTAHVNAQEISEAACAP